MPRSEGSHPLPFCSWPPGTARASLLFLRRTPYCPASRPLNRALLAKNAFPMAQSLTSFSRLQCHWLLRCHFHGPPCVPPWLIYLFPLLYYSSHHFPPLGTLSIDVFVGFLSSQGKVNLWAGTFCFVYFCVSSTWFITSPCISRANGPGAHTRGRLEQHLWGKLLETGAIRGPRFLITFWGITERSSKCRC